VTEPGATVPVGPPADGPVPADSPVPAGGGPVTAADPVTAVDRLVEAAGARPILVVVDFDGTVAEIDPHPMGATILPAARRALRRLARLARTAPHRLTVAVLSGRTAADVARRVRVGGLHYLGNHGNERGWLPPRRPAERLEVALLPALVPFAERARRLGTTVAAELARVVGRTAGGEPVAPEWLYVEDKGPAVAFHYRAAPDPAAALAALETAIARAGADGATSGFRRLDGRLVVEFQPEPTLDKGGAVARLLEEVGPGAAVVLGDDRSDALAFAVVREARGSGRLAAALAVAVEGGREVPPEVRAAADLVVARPRDAARLLARLAAALEARLADRRSARTTGWATGSAATAAAPYSTTTSARRTSSRRRRDGGC
jgi:trehalose 6-phosphate phosphatase